MNRYLFVIDYQNDFVDGALGFPGAEALDPGIAAKVRAYGEGHVLLFRYACYRLGSVAETEDAIQDLYVRLSKQSSRLAEIDDLQGYVYRSLSNSCASRLRSRHQFVPSELLNTLSSDDLTPTDFDEEFRLIERLMAQLPEEQSEVIRLRIYGSRQFDEIASICDIPLTTAKSRFRYGIDKLRNALEEQGLI